MKRCYAGEDKRRGSGGQRPENGVWCVLCSPSSNPLSRYSALRHPSSCERAEGLQVMRPSLYHGQQPFSRCISGNASAAMHQRQCISGLSRPAQLFVVLEGGRHRRTNRHPVLSSPRLYLYVG